VPDYPDNQPNKFRVHLPKSLYFSGDWVCGVHSISYPYSWSSTIGTLDEQWIDINFTDNNKKGQTIRIPVPKGSHNTPEEILQFLISTLRHQSSALDNTALEESSEGFFDKPTIINRRNKRQHEELEDLTPYNENEEENESLRSLSPYQEDVEETLPPQKDKINLTKQPEKEKVEEQKKVNEKKKEEDQKKEEEKKKEQPREEPKKEVDQKKLEEKVEEKKKDDKVGKEQPKLEKKKEDFKEKVPEKKKEDEQPREEPKKGEERKKEEEKSKVEEKKKDKEQPVEEQKKELPKEKVLSVLGVGKKEEEKPRDSSVLSAIGLEKKEEKKEVLRELSPYKEEEPLPPPPKKERKEQSNDTRVKDNSTQTPSVLSALGLERKESWTQTPSPLLETIGLKPKEGNFAQNKSLNWVDILEKILGGINKSKCRVNGLRPIDIDFSNAQEVWERMYGTKFSKRIKSKLKKGDFVRLSIGKGAFEKGYIPNWGDQIVRVDKVQDQFYPVRYKIINDNGDKFKGYYYREELARVKKDADTEYRIEKVIRKKKRADGTYDILVKFIGYPEREWIHETQLV